ncbi:hypothetical protein [Parablautia sp. Marseille-Q6255]|uniref:hypothetical protein n=1 Tax=Parablautia sp. Marseille-Q6255 TaxID=3039593 RepID=UPI0024BD4055|nr:hypothetical protein [Parablautia sp. Marseille-Q6255]
MEESKKEHPVSDADLQALIENWEQMPKRDAAEIAYAEGILYAIAVLLPDEENVLTAGKQSQDRKLNNSRSL